MGNPHENIAMAVVKPNWDHWGLIDVNGNYVLDPVYETIFDWKDGIALLEKISTKIDVGGKWTNHYNGKYGFINDSGTLITDFSFGYANDFSNGFAAVNKNKEWGFIDTSGKLSIPCQFEDIKFFEQESCVVKADKKWGLINKQGKWEIENRFEHLSAFSFGLAIAETKSGIIFKDERKFVIDKKGDKIIDLPKEWKWFQPVSNNLILIGTSSGYPGERTYGFMDLNGRIVSKPQFYTDSDNLFDVGEFSEGMLPVRNKNGVKGFINEEGELVIPLRFKSTTAFKNGIAKVSTENETFYIDKSGATVDYKEPKPIKRPFDEVLQFSESLAVAKKNNLWGVIDENNDIIVDFIYKRRFWRTVGDRGLFFTEQYPKYSCGLMGVNEEREDNVYAGYLDRDGKTFIDLQFRVAKPFTVPSGSPGKEI